MLTRLLHCGIAILSLACANRVFAYPYNDSLDDLPESYDTTGVETRTSGTVQSYNIPISDYPDEIVFSLIRGGDGGNVTATAAVGSNQTADGGGGAEIVATFPVHPTDANALRPGGELRFIIGSKGGNKTSTDVSASGGGGGTGILYRAPTSGAEWEPLAIAGGGGGAISSTQVLDTYSKDGKNANTVTSGDQGGGVNGGPGGTDGEYGQSLEVTGYGIAGGGGGWLSDSGTNGGEKGQYAGGSGGTASSGGSAGGFGCGGGGGSWSETQVGGAGGGGGYSGGGGGDQDGTGGGGGSYLDSRATGTISSRNGSGSNGKVTFTAPLVNGNDLPFPTITLTGDSALTVYFGSSFDDPGATATDPYGNALTVDTEIPTGLQNGTVGEYQVYYSATDQFGRGTLAVRTVSVIYHRPTFDLTGDVTILQGAGAQSISNFAYNFDANDSGQSLDSYEVTNNKNSLFSVQPAIDNNGTLTFTANNSSSGVATVSVVAIDDPDTGDDGRSLTVTFTITVTAATKPTFDLSGDVTLLQGAGAQSIGNFAYNFNANDSGQSLDSYEVTTNNSSLFSVQPAIDTSGTLTFTAKDDSSGVVIISVVAIDDPDIGSNGRSLTQTFTLTVTAATKPTFDLAGDINVDEDAGPQSVGNFAANFNANDAGQSLVAYQVSNDNNALFSTAPAIDTSGTLTFTPADNTTGSAVVSVVAIDDEDIGDNGLSLTRTFTITVDPVTDLPTDLELTNNQVDDGFVGRVGIVMANDPLGGDLSFAIVGGADAAVFTLEETSVFANGMSLEVATALDYGAPADADGNNDYEITVAVTNAEGTITADFIIYVNELNVAPTALSLDSSTVDENVSFVGTLAGEDPNEGDTLTYSIIGGADASLFSCDASTGEVSFLSPPDFENPQDNNLDNRYRVLFAVSDGEFSFSSLIIIVVQPVDEGPINLQLDGASVTSIDLAEGTSDGTQIAVLNAQDPENSGPVSFSLSDDAGGRFAITNGNRLIVSDSSQIDFEVSESHEITVLATDATGQSTSTIITINIIDVAETALSEYRSTYGLAADGSDDFLDWSQNGIVNILYFAFGLGDPSEANIDRSRLPAFSTDDSGNFVFSYVRPISDGSGLSFSVQTSDDLTNWYTPNELGAAYEAISEEVTNLDATHETVAQTFDFVSSESKRFYRLEVSQP